MVNVSVVNLANESKGTMQLNSSVFHVPCRTDIVHTVVRWQLAKRQAGTHSSRTISMVQGTTKKPFKQKGTGRARQGSLRAPHMRGGSVVFGPVPRSHEFKLNKKVRQLALKMVLSAKLAEGNLIVLDSLVTDSFKTKILAQQLNDLGISSALFVDGIGNTPESAAFIQAASNLAFIDVLPVGGLNVYDILRHKHLVLTRQAITNLEERLQ